MLSVTVYYLYLNTRAVLAELNTTTELGSGHYLITGGVVNFRAAAWKFFPPPL